MALNKYKKDFLINFKADAERVCPKYGVSPAVCVAQAILESGWGFFRLRRLNKALKNTKQSRLERKRGYNYFGIKGSGDAGVQVWKTKEYRGTKKDGKLVVIKDNFAKYSSRDAGIRAYCKFITKKRYAAAANVFINDPARYIVYIWGKGYATSINYPRKIVDVMNSIAYHSHDKSYQVKIDEKLDIIIKKLQKVPAGRKRWQLCEKLFKKDHFGLKVKAKKAKSAKSKNIWDKFLGIFSGWR